MYWNFLCGLNNIFSDPSQSIVGRIHVLLKPVISRVNLVGLN